MIKNFEQYFSSGLAILSAVIYIFQIFNPNCFWVGTIFIFGGFALLLWGISAKNDEAWRGYLAIPSAIIAIAYGLYIAITGFN
ncbi:MAG: hypothetical protein Kow002_05670 [Anaerolineales bacterium]